METKKMPTESIKLLIFDEADKMFEEGFSDQIQRILKQLTTTSSTTTKRKQQILAFSATYPEDVLKTISSFMKNPQHVLLNVDTPTLQGMIAYLFVGRSIYLLLFFS